MCRRRDNNLISTIFLLLLLVSSEINAFGRPRSHKQHKIESKNDCSNRGGSIKNDSSAEKASASLKDLDPYYDKCDLMGFGVVQKIPYQITPNNGPLDVNLSSACVRCGICIAIVERINQSLIDAHDIMDANEWFNETEIHLFLEAICDDGFRHYALREIEGERYIGDSITIPGATSVTSTVDGQWESILKNKCHDILEDVSPQKLYKHWQDWCNDEAMAKPLIEILCRNPDSGRLRDCQNMKGDATKFPAVADDLCMRNFDWRARVKITTEFNSK